MSENDGSQLSLHHNANGVSMTQIKFGEQAIEQHCRSTNDIMLKTESIDMHATPKEVFKPSLKVLKAIVEPEADGQEEESSQVPKATDHDQTHPQDSQYLENDTRQYFSNYKKR